METTAARASASSAELRSWAFVASLVGGVLVAAGGLVGGAMMLMMSGMMEMMSMMNIPFFPLWMPIWGLVTGGAMIVGAFSACAPQRTTPSRGASRSSSRAA